MNVQGLFKKNQVKKTSIICILASMFIPQMILANTPNSSLTKENPADFTENFHGFLQLGTDHVWRGISFSNHIPEIFGSILYDFTSGIYGGVIAYDTKLSNGGIGVAPIFGIKAEHNKLNYDVSARYEIYPKYNTLVTPNIFEIYGELGYALYQPLKILVGLGYSPNYYFHSGNGLYANTLATIRLPKSYTFDGGIGYQTTQRGGKPNNIWFKNHLNYVVGIGKNLKNNYKIGFRYTNTSLNNRECYDLNICNSAYNLYARKSF